MTYTVKKVAELAGVTLRTLRYYDAIGLLNPSHRTPAGYRMYCEADLHTLQHILLLRKLDFPLKKIGDMLRSPCYDRQTELELQVKYLEKQAEHYLDLVQLAKKTLSAIKGGIDMDQKDLFEPLSTYHSQQLHLQYEQEAQLRWGHTDSYRTYDKRAGQYSADDWQQIATDQQLLLQAIKDVFLAGTLCTHPQASAVVERHRLWIDRHFYPCSWAMMEQLGQMYLEDARFKQYYDDAAPGLAQYYHDAIVHCCHNQ